MAKTLAIAALVMFSLVFVARPANAFECPKHFTAAQAAIDKALKGMKGMSKMMSKKNMALVHTLVDDAKMLLAGAIHNHKKPQRGFDHARAIAKADAAKGYAEAADIYHFKYLMKKSMKMKK